MVQGPGTYLNLTASGNVLPMSFVKLDTTLSETCLQCGAADVPIGVSGTWTRYAGGTPANDLENATFGGYEATAGEFPQVASIGCVVPLTCGNTGWSAGMRLKPDANGFGIPVAATTDVAGALALEATTANAIGRVLVLVAATAGTLTALEVEAANKQSEEEALPGIEHEDALRLTKLMRKEQEDTLKAQEEAAEKEEKEKKDKGKDKDKDKDKPPVKPEPAHAAAAAHSHK